MKIIRFLAWLFGMITFLLGLAFAFRLSFAASLWLWPDGKLSYLFIGSILVAASASLLWIGWSGGWTALAGGSLNVLVITTTSAIFLFLQVAHGRSFLLLYAILAAIGVFAALAAFLWSRRLPVSDSRPMPLLVRISFWIFLAVLLLSGIALLFHRQIFPWILKPDSASLFGCIFLGNAVYFLYGLVYPRWQNAIGQLLSFLAYDLVLIFPFLALFGSVQPQLRLNLIVYVVILVYSAAVAVYFIFLHRETRRLSAVVPARIE